MTFEETDELYPFDPKAKAEHLVGLEKMRAFDAPVMRRAVFDIYASDADRKAARRPRLPPVPHWTEPPEVEK